jgi:hypothetical protein
LLLFDKKWNEMGVPPRCANTLAALTITNQPERFIMATTSLDHHSFALNLSLDSLDRLHKLIDKSYALAHVAMSDRFAACSDDIIDHYLGALRDLLDDTKKMLKQIEEEQPDIEIML